MASIRLPAANIRVAKRVIQIHKFVNELKVGSKEPSVMKIE